MTKKPTIAAVAAAAGVAVSTVSRYLNGHYVSQSVRARLGEVIESLGYSRSWTARNLSLGRRGCIAVIVDSSADPWFVQLLTGIEEELSTRGKPRRIAVDRGALLELQVTGDELDSVSLEGEVEVITEDTNAIFNIYADTPGTYPIELVDANRIVGTLVVRE